jgi:hypothetical protein
LTIKAQLLATAVSVALLAAASAQLPIARLDTIFPFGAKAGTTTEIEVAGAELDGPVSLIFDHAGIKAEPVSGTRFKVQVAPDVPPGAYELRFSGRWGVSAPRWFTVGDGEEALVTAEAKDLTKAPSMTPRTVYNGRAEAGQANYFRIAAKAGERFFVDCAADRIGSRMDALLVLFDASGTEVARSREAKFGDPLLDYTANADGELILQVSDFLVRGGVDYGFRITLNSGPQIDHVLPASAVPGTRQTFQVFGHNLPGGIASADGMERAEISVDVPADAQRRHTSPLPPAATGTQGFHLNIEGSNPYFIAHGDAPAVLDAGGNNRSEAAQIVAVPSEVSGRFYPGGVEWFGFDAVKGKTYIVDVFGQRASAPSDPVLEVFKRTVDVDGKEGLAKIGGGDDEGKNIGGRAYRTDHRDPAFRFTADADGSMRVALRDQFGTLSTFRLRISEPKPGFDVIVAGPAPDGDNNGGKRVFHSGVALRRGQTVELPVAILRRDGFNSEVELEVEGLPAGFTAAPSVVHTGRDNGSIALRMAADAPAWSGAIRVFGKAGDRREAAHPVSVNWTSNDADQERVFSQVGSALTVAGIEEVAPVVVTLAEEKIWETSIGGKLEIPLKLAMSGEIKDKINVRVVELLGLGNKPMQTAIEKDKDVGTLVMEFFNNRDNNKFTTGTHSFALAASTKIGYRRDVDKSTAAEEAKKAAAADADAKRKARDESKKALDTARASTAETDVEKQKRVADSELALKAAEEALKVAEETMRKSEEAAKAAAERAKPRDLLVSDRTFPITLKLAATPIRLVPPAAPLTVAKGAAVEVPVQFERLYGFADEVRFSAKLPDGTAGVSAPEVAVAKDAGKGALVINTAAEAKPGELAIELIAKMKFNGIDLEERHPIKLIITAP